MRDAPAVRKGIRHVLALTALAVYAASCSTYQPLRDRTVYRGPMRAPAGPGVTVTYFGNTTILISDGETRLLVDGFFSRPGLWDARFGRVKPDPSTITHQLAQGGIDWVTAILVGHSHYDHALDAPTVALATGAKVLGSSSYGMVHAGVPHTTGPRFVSVPAAGLERTIGRFTVRFRPSEHVPPHLPTQDRMTGQISAPVRPLAPATDYKHGDVFVLHIAHPEGTVAITTTAGARKGQFAGLHAHVVMLAVGLLSKEPPRQREFYWDETVTALDPHTVIPVHWDRFTSKLDRREPPVTPPPATRLLFIDDARAAMRFVKCKAAGRTVRVMGLRDSFVLRGGAILPAPSGVSAPGAARCS